MKLSIQGQARLNKFADKAKEPIEEVQEIYKDELAKLKENGVEKNLEKLAINKTMNVYRKKVQPKQSWMKGGAAKAIYGFLIGDQGMVDRIEIMRSKIKRFVNKEGIEAARDKQYINGDNRVLDQRKTIFGRENPDYLEPLPENLKVLGRILWGFFRKNGDKTFKLSSFQTGDNKIARAWSQVKFLKPCQTFANIKEQTKNSMTLSSSQAQDTMSVFKALEEDWDVRKIILDGIKGQITPINKAEDHYKALKKIFMRKIIVRGIVSWMNLDRPSPWGSVWIGLMDTEEGLEGAHQIRLSVPSHISIDFGEGSEVVIFGKTRRSQYRDPDTGKKVDSDVVIDVFAIYPVLVSPKVSTGADSVEDGAAIEGWLN